MMTLSFFLDEVSQMDDSLRNVPKMIVFIDSTECSKCRISNFIRYEPAFALSDSTRAFKMMLLLSVRKKDLAGILEHVELIDLPFPVFFDTDNAFRRDNPVVPDDTRFHSFLVGKDNVPIFVGDPSVNEKMEGLLREAVEKL